MNPNPFDSSIRDETDLKFMDFNKLDTGNDRINQNLKHFIKRKQNQVNIKRRCGVSYVVPSESKQMHVRDRYE